jgi:hypothetical protein
MAVAAERGPMDPTDLSDAQLDQLADQLAGRLPSGTHGDRVVLSRRAFAAAVGGTLGASGLVALGVDPAAAQAAGQVGTSSDPVDAFAYNLDVQNGATFNGTDISGVGSFSTDTIGSYSLTVGPTSQKQLDPDEQEPNAIFIIQSFGNPGRSGIFKLDNAGGANDIGTAKSIGTSSGASQVNIFNDSGVVVVENTRTFSLNFDILKIRL